jgi:hypothetical protein
MIVGLVAFGVCGTGVAAASTVPTAPTRAQVTSVNVIAPSSVSVGQVVTSSLTSSYDSNASLKVANFISKQYKVPVASVLRLRNAGWGYDEIYKLHDYSKQTGKNMAVIRTMRNAGIDWNNIAEALNLKPSDVAGDLRSAFTTAELTDTLPLTNTYSEETEP